MRPIEGKLSCPLANAVSLDDIVNIAVLRSNMSQCFALKYGRIGDKSKEISLRSIILSQTSLFPLISPQPLLQD
jgi:hypothetical protein